MATLMMHCAAGKIFCCVLERSLCTITMNKTKYLAGAAMFGVVFLAANVNTQRVPQTVEIRNRCTRICRRLSGGQGYRQQRP